MGNSRQGQQAGNLPSEATSFVGREAELSAMGDLLLTDRLVTLTGVGGVGKTRLAQRAGAEARAAFPDGVWLVELSPLKDVASLPLAVYEALRLADQSTRPAVEVVTGWLSDKRLLLILDCCEHLAAGCADFAQQLLAAAPGVHILASSRCPLRAPDECVVSVPPLPVTVAGPRHGAAPADAEVLFRERAAAAAPRTVLTEQDGAAIADICTRLEGIPLAIELAAARLPEMPLDQLRQRLHTRFETLTAGDGPGRQGEPRHQALRTTIGWSHELCAPLERLLWARLSAFAGGFEEEAVAWVCSGGPLDSDRTAGLLSSLADKSVLQQTETPRGTRYWMLDTVREFGQEWLCGLGEERRLHRRHRDYYRWLARTGHREWPAAQQVAWYDRSTAEYANLRAALECCLADPDPRYALEMTGDLWFFWFCYGFQREGRHYLGRALDKAPIGDRSPERFWALWACGMVAIAQGDREVAAVMDSACAVLADRLGDPTTAAGAATLKGARYAANGRSDEAVALLGAAVRSPAFGADVPTVRFMALCSVTIAYLNLRAFAPLTTTADILRRECEQVGEQWYRAYALYCLSAAAMGTGDPAAALRHGTEALRMKWRLHDTLGTAMTLETLASALAAADPEQAARLLGIADNVWSSFGRAQAGIPGLIAARQACERPVRAALGDASYEAAHSKGQETDIDTGIAYVLSLETP
ncbi:ATP-binding protein [Streptomyces purpurogeneiscleroticus]|uniref:ATP-binding protein n=1 Tax=Streptomyces purpurogeneiscleroticus TaxID=68259 RepID=UPI001CC18297|nr:hypothetical protein [Streptomyces purpurogeneiscleroticus]MBZ4019376.1 hypothetical protein [Streptomyces purpurogeneiscleroticus]